MFVLVGEWTVSGYYRASSVSNDLRVTISTARTGFGLRK